MLCFMSRPIAIRLLLVDDHSVVRMGLAAVLSLEKDFQILGEAEDGRQAVERYRELHPDVVLMDVRMPTMDGIAALQALRQEAPTAKILMLTTSELDEDIERVIDAGASGYLPKSVTRGELVKAIRHVHAGGRYLTPATEQRLAELSKLKHLSGREHEVLDGMRRGLSNRDIATALGISEHTVKAHVKAVLQKLESADRAEAVARGFEKGLLRVSDSS
ncbi:MAG: hypothetical protein QG602_570 [Verrucomicrobiota bacterium]|nr:hypothetical protein [Verrucomicrobiota bacterium]